MRKQTNTLSPSPKGFQSQKFSDSDFREVRGLRLGLGRPKSSGHKGQGVYIIRWDFNEGFLFHVAHRINLPLDGARIR
jgi:hypothetical protein